MGRPARGAVRPLHARLLARTTTRGAGGDYPALFVTAGLNDPRVSYHEPAKWVAKLRAVGAGTTARCCCAPRWAPATAGPSGRYEAWRDEARTLTFLLATSGITS